MDLTEPTLELGQAHELSSETHVRDLRGRRGDFGRHRRTERFEARVDRERDQADDDEVFDGRSAALTELDFANVSADFL